MAATANLQFQLKVVLSGQEITWPSRGSFSPYTLATSADILLQEQVSLPNTTATELLSLGAAADIESALTILIIPTVACTITWRLSSDANNHSVRARANWPFILPTGQTVPYTTTTANSVIGTPASITSISAYQSSGAAGIVHLLALA